MRYTIQLQGFLVQNGYKYIYVIGRLVALYKEYQQHFQARGHSFSLHRPTLSRSTPLFIFLLAVNWLTRGCVYLTETLPLNRLTRSLQTIRKNLTSDERVIQILDKERCIKDKFISNYFMLVALSLPVIVL